MKEHTLTLKCIFRGCEACREREGSVDGDTALRHEACPPLWVWPLLSQQL